MFQDNSNLSLWGRALFKLHRGYLIIRFAAIDPIYLYTTLTDLGWGLNILSGGKYQPHIPEFDFFNTKTFAVFLTCVGLVGVWNFFNRRTWILVLHSSINCLFYLYITAIFFQIRDGAWVRNGTMTLCIIWIIWRIQMNGWRMQTLDRFIPKGH